MTASNEVTERERQLEVLLAEGLDLCVRARQMDAMDRRQAALSVSKYPAEWQADGTFDRYVEMHNKHFTDQPISTRCATMALWVQDQYEKDLADWERRARAFLMPPGFSMAARLRAGQQGE